MEFNKRIATYVALMLLTGVCNTLLTKYQDKICVRDCDVPSLRQHFEQPVLQTAQMFVGEMGCFLVSFLITLLQKYGVMKPSASDEYEPVADSEESEESHDVTAQKNREILAGKGVFLLAIPAVCDICGTTLMNAGLLLVAASIYQMTRGALVLFVGLLSVTFLKRKLALYKWVSLAGVMAGVAIVGLAGALFPDQPVDTPIDGTQIPVATMEREPSTLMAIIGVLLIAGAQVFTATQFVVEEYLLARSTIHAVNVVGWQGTFGFSITSLGMVLAHIFYGSTDAGRYGMFDLVEGWRQMTASPQVLYSSVAIMVSIGGFNFFGLSVTRSVSATARSTIDTCRTLFIWIVSLALGWESFKALQVLGFVFLVYFTFLFNDIVEPPFEFLRVKKAAIQLPDDEADGRV